MTSPFRESTIQYGLPTKEDLSEFDEVDPDAHASTGDLR